MSDPAPAPPPAPASFSPEEAVLKLRRLHLFDALNQAEFNEVAHLLKSKQVAAGEVLYAQGEANWTMYLARSGRLQARRTDGEGKESVIGAAEAGRIFNVLPFVSRCHTLETVQAEVPSRVWMIEHADFEEHARKNPGLMGKLLISDDDARKILRGDPMFARLNEAELDMLIGAIQEVKLKPNEIVYKQGAYKSDLYFLRAGILVEHRVDLSGNETFYEIASPGKILNTKSFVIGTQNEETVETDTEAIFWQISQSKIDNVNSTLRKKIVLKKDIESILTPAQLKRRFDWQAIDETILFESRRHWWFFLRQVFMPLTIMTVLGAISFFILTKGDEILKIIFLCTNSLVLTGIAVTLLRHLINWMNQYYVVTDKRIIRRERILFWSDQQKEISVSQVQDVTITQPGVLSQILDIGDVNIEAQGNASFIVFDFTKNPNKAKEIIFQARERSYAMTHVIQRADARRALRNRLKDMPTIPPLSGMKKTENVQKKRNLIDSKRKKESIRNTIWPFQRKESNGNIIYRKHWLELIISARTPLITIALLSLFTFLIVLFGSGVGTAIFLLGALNLIAVVFFIWRYEDWRNDYYILTEDRVIDIERSPFGIAGIKQKEASFAVIQSVDSKVEGFWNSRLNVGDVIIRTAGMNNEITFKRIWNPRLVQRDIESRMRSYRIRQEEKASEKRTKEITDMFSLYDQIKESRGS